jgi:hypothetical protein
MYHESWLDRHFSKIMLAFIGVVLLLFYIIISAHNERTTDHYKQCLDDGKKEYECYAIVYNGGRR